MNFEIYDFYNPWWKNRHLNELKEHLLKDYNRSKLQRDYSLPGPIIAPLI